MNKTSKSTSLPSDAHKFVKSREFQLFLSQQDPEEFTIYDVLRNGNFEIRHSNTLAWLFDYKAKHALGKYFLREYLKSLVADKGAKRSSKTIRFQGEKCEITTPAGIFDLSKIHYRVERELYDTDVIVISENAKFVLVIENKPGVEADGQLAAYRKRIDKLYPPKKYLRIFAFLTNYGTQPAGDSSWLPSSYESVVAILDKALADRRLVQKIGDPRIVDFLKQYVYNLKKNLINYFDQSDTAIALFKRNKRLFETVLGEKSHQRQIAQAYGSNYAKAIRYILLRQSQLPLAVLMSFKDTLGTRGFEIFHRANEKQPWYNFHIPEIQKLFKRYGYTSSPHFNLGLEPDMHITFNVQLYMNSDIRPLLLKHTNADQVFSLVWKVGHAACILQKPLLGPTDFADHGQSEAIALAESCFDNCLKEDLPKISKALLDIVKTHKKSS